ncbi:hypothetical protein AcV7_010204 [Taiwanofungus camphoratus]|nr:hypothetical protein AcV7_010204 [Antrodia cinnamomea]
MQNRMQAVKMQVGAERQVKRPWPPRLRPQPEPPTASPYTEPAQQCTVLPAPNACHPHINPHHPLRTFLPYSHISKMPKETTKSTKRKAADKAEKAPKSKAKKDPKAPKRALSAYMFFSQDWRERIKAENPDAGFGEIGKLLGAKWKELDDSEKKPYIEQAARDKARAEQEKTEYDGKKGESAGSGGDGDDDDE